MAVRSPETAIHAPLLTVVTEQIWWSFIESTEMRSVAPAKSISPGGAGAAFNAAGAVCAGTFTARRRTERATILASLGMGTAFTDRGNHRTSRRVASTGR